MEPYKRRDAEKLYNELLQQVQQQIISYRESTKNKLSRIEETIQSLVQEVKGNSVGDCVKEQEEFMNPFASKEWNTRSLSHLQIMFPKLEGAEVIKCSPDSEHQEFTGKPIYDEEPGEDQECWPEKEFILAALSGHNPNSSKRLQPEICTSERPKASEDLSNTQMTQDMNTHSPLQRLKSIRLEEVLSMIPTSRETFEAFLSKGIVKYFIAALIPHNLSITSSEFGNGNILNFDPGGQKKNEQTKGVMACVTTEEKDLYYLLDHSFHPLDLASQVQPLLIKISKLGAKLSSVSSIPEVQLSQYISSFEKLTTLRLLQQISQEFDDNNCFEGYWLLNNSLGPVVEHGFCEKESTTPLMSQLKSNGMVRWGIRRQVKFFNNHGDNSTGHPQSSASFVRGSEEKLQYDEDNVAGKHEQEGEEKDNDEDEEEEEIENELYEDNKETFKRKRYKLAERNLLEVMKTKGEVFHSPSLRPELILEARKRIGDTGLLDHLLKHVSCKLAPGGAERFRRRHNADGTTKYWLESADLVRVRKEAGVQEPYWTPPPGWTLGDCPSQDPICAKEFRLLKEENAKSKRDMENMLSKKQLKKELQNLRREINMQVSKMQEKILALKSSGAISQNLNIEVSLMAPWKSDFDSALVRVNKQTKQLTEISESLIGMKDEIGKLNSMVGLASKTDRFDKIIREINQQYVDSVKTWMTVLPYKYKSRCIDLRQGSPGKVMRFEIHDAWRRKYTITIFDPGGRKWSHEINHEDMVVFQGGRIVRKCRYLGLINNYYKGIEYVEYALVIRSCCVLTYKVVLQRHSCNMYDGSIMLSWKHGIVLCRWAGNPEYMQGGEYKWWICRD